MSKTAYWYCPNCHEEVDSSRVTWQELHDACGHPVEWIEDIAIDRIREICQAEREGRLVVLPCKVGDTVYVDADTLHNGWMMEKACQGILIGRVTSYRITKDKMYVKIKFRNMKQQTYFIDNYSIKSFGKTVFLSREEAEGALGMEGEK